MGVDVAQRYIKIGLTGAVGLLAGLWFINNLLNWETALGAVGYALSQQNHSGYSIQLIPAIESATAALVGLLLVCGAEAVAATLELFGAVKMWSIERKKVPSSVQPSGRLYWVLASRC